jgi:metal-responsive CopG/Arc/MetJ family transcriptional regulator
MNFFNKKYIISMNNKIPDDQKKVKISISVDPFLDKKIGEMAIDRKFYKKSRFIEYILKKYIEDNKSSL